MPYEGEFAGYRSIRRLVGADAVQQLLKRARVAPPNVNQNNPTPSHAPEPSTEAPAFVVGIDGSYNEVSVRNGYPGAHVGYCTVASVLINLKLIDQLDELRPVDPQHFRKTEEAATVDAALPGSNLVTRNHTSARDAFREAVFDVLHDKVVDEEDRTRLLDTYETLLALKPQGRGQSCPYDHTGCDEHIVIPCGNTNCPCGKLKPIYSTDALRIHEHFPTMVRTAKPSAWSQRSGVRCCWFTYFGVSSGRGYWINLAVWLLSSMGHWVSSVLPHGSAPP